jgi:hypothetical protein
VHRWSSPTGDILDLVPAGAHWGGSGQAWDQIAIESKVLVDLGEGLVIAHANAAAFLALKWAAYADRGIEDPFASHDLEDILGLIASRPGLSSEIRVSSPELRVFVSEHTARLLEHPDLKDLLAGHLNNAQNPRHAIDNVARRLEEILTAAATD